DRLLALAALHQPRCAIAAGRPEPPALPACVRVVDATVEPLGVEPQRVGDAQHDHLAVLQRDQSIVEVARRHRHVLAEAERVVLVYPAVVARLRAVLTEALEARARVLIDGPALGAVIARRLRPVGRAFALAAVEAAEVAAAERSPHHALLVDVGAANAEVRLRDEVDLAERGGWRVRAGGDADDRTAAAGRGGRQGRTPDRAVDGARHDRVEAAGDPLVLRRIDG